MTDSELIDAIAKLGGEIAGLKAKVEALESDKRRLTYERDELQGVVETFGRAVYWKELDTNTVKFSLTVDEWTLRAGGRDVFMASIKKLFDEVDHRTDILRGKKYA